MKVTLERVNNSFQFEAIGSTGIPVAIDASPQIGGHNKGARPMELLLMGLGGCSGIDIIEILKKQKQALESFYIDIEAERIPDKLPSIFKSIHLHFKLGGDLNTKFVERAIQLSLDKYCSVGAIISKTAEINYSYEIIKINKPGGGYGNDF
ncbi:OsmC family protein [candidate division KSB1 bacterium]|nr:OsmC family protein [candidate division KSB1 bacterium]